MWLVFAGVAALVSTFLWLRNLPSDRYRLGFLALVYWGATLMWLVDHILAYIEEGGPFLDFSASSWLLGVAVVALGGIVWLGRLILGRRRA